MAGILALAVAWLVGGPYTTTMPRVFDSGKWKKADLDGDERCAMLADLTYRVGIVGKTRAELHNLLGKPDDRRRDPASNYWLLCPSFADIYVLEVEWRGNRAASAYARDT
jgi:hypothetical protein